MIQRRVLRETLSIHSFVMNPLKDGSMSRFQKFGPSSTIYQKSNQSSSAWEPYKQGKECGNPASVWSQHWYGLDQDNTWAVKPAASVFAVTSRIVTTNIFDKHVCDTEDHVFPRQSITQSFKMHFNTLYFRCYVDLGKGGHYIQSSLDLAHRGLTNKPSFVDNLERQTKRLVSCMSCWQDAIQNFKQCSSPGIVILMVTVD